MRPSILELRGAGQQGCDCRHYVGNHHVPLEPPADVNVSNLAELGAVVGDPARVSMLVALLHVGELTARQLADRAGVTPQTASGHLGRLLAAGLLSVERRGRYHHYRLASEDAGVLVTALHVAGARLRPINPRPRSNHRADMRLLRVCRLHMAGRLAVAIAEVVFDGDASPDRVLAGSARRLLARWGLDVSINEYSRLDACLDWSEGRRHIGGALGAAMLAHSVSLGWVRRGCTDQELALTPAGRVGFQQRFGVPLSGIGEAA